MATKHVEADADPRECERSHEMWVNFTKLLKYSTISIIILLVLMSWFLL